MNFRIFLCFKIKNYLNITNILLFYGFKRSLCFIGKINYRVKIEKIFFKNYKNICYYVQKFLMSKQDLRSFLYSYCNKSSSTLREVYFSLRFFYKFVFLKNFIQDFQNLPLAKSSKKLPVVLTKFEIKKMIKSTDNIKHKLIIIFLYYTGLRLSELINLRHNDIDLKRKIIHIRKSKGNKERVVFLHDELINAIKLYKYHKKNSNYFFL